MHICIAVVICFLYFFTYSICAYYDDYDHLKVYEEENENGYSIIDNNNVQKFDSITNNNNNIQKFGCTKHPNLICLLYGNVGCYLLCNIEAILYGCLSFDATCRKGIYCECNEVFELPSNNLISYDHFSDMSLETLWYYRFTDNDASSAMLNKIIKQWGIDDEIREILSYPHLSGQEIKDLFMEQLPNDKDVRKLQIQVHGQKDKILSSGKKFEYDKLGVYYIDLFMKAAEKSGPVKFNKRMKKLLNSIDNKEELRYVAHEVNNTTNERLKKAIKSFLAKKGLSSDDDEDDLTRYSNNRKTSLQKVIKKNKKMRNKADDYVSSEEESDMGYDPPTYKKVILKNGDQPKTIYDDEDHIIEVSVINNMMKIFDKRRKSVNNDKCVGQEISNVDNKNLNDEDFDLTSQIQLKDGKKDIFRSTKFTDNTPNSNLKTNAELQFQEINDNTDIQYNTNYHDNEYHINYEKSQELNSGNVKLINIICGDVNDDHEEDKKIMDRKSLQSINSNQMFLQDQESTNELLLVDKFEGPIIDDPDLSCFLFGNTGCHYLCNIHSLLYGCEYESECVNNVYCVCGEVYKFPNNEEITYNEFTELPLDKLWNYRFKKTKPSRRILKDIKNDSDLAAKVRDILSYPHLSGSEVQHLLSDLLDHDHDIDDLKVNIHGQKDNILFEEEHLKYDNLESHFPELYKEIKQDVSKMKYIERMKKLLGKIKERDVLETIMQAIHDTGNDTLLRPIVRSFLEKAETNSAGRPSKKKNQFISKMKSIKDGNMKSPTFKEVSMSNGKEEITIENDEDFIIEVGLINDMIKFVDERNAKRNKQSGKNGKKGKKQKKREKSSESDEQSDDDDDGSFDRENSTKMKSSKKQKKKCDSSKESEQQCEENISDDNVKERDEEESFKYVEQISKNVEPKIQQNSKSLCSYPPIAKGHLQKKSEYTGSYKVIYKRPLNSNEDIVFEYYYSYTGSYNWKYSDGRNKEKYCYSYSGTDEYSCDCYPDFVKPKLIADFLLNPHPY